MIKTQPTYPTVETLTHVPGKQPVHQNLAQRKLPCTGTQGKKET